MRRLVLFVLASLAGCASSTTVMPTEDAQPRDGGARTDAQLLDATAHDAPPDAARVDSGMPPVRTWAEFGLGHSHSCVIGSDGRLACFGWNPSGQLGDGTREPRGTPVAIAGSDWSAVGGGAASTCALRTDGTLWCWGSDEAGQLGNGPGRTDSTTPVQIRGPDDWRSIAIGQAHACAIDAEAGLWCWGSGLTGALGTGTDEDRDVPIPVRSGERWRSASAGWTSTCAIRDDGTLSCWGTLPGTFVVGALELAGPWRTVSVGQRHACAIADDGTLSCWGENTYGQLGDGTTEARVEPVRVGADADWIDVSAGGGMSTCGVRADGTLWCWGWNAYDQLGAGERSFLTPHPTPLRVGDETGWRRVRIGYAHVCGAREGGETRCWGHDAFGELGDGVDRATPSPIEGVWRSISTAGEHTCGVRVDGSAFCWGFDSGGHLGVGESVEMAQTPLRVDDAIWRDVRARGHHTCGLRDDASLWCWGLERAGPITRPSRIGTETDWTALAVGQSHTCGIQTDGRIWCWGENGEGQLGDGTTARRDDPVLVADGGFSSIAAGRSHTCAIDATGVLWCWGANSSGQSGAPLGTSSSSIPTRVGVPADWTSVVAGQNHTCALRSDRSLWCWGSNSYGQLADGTRMDRSTPMPVAGEWIAAACGSMSTCAVRADGSLWCWGYALRGQTRIDPDVALIVPVRVGSEGGWSSIAIGEDHACAVRTDGEGRCWGNAWWGQIGDGTSWRLEPRAIAAW